MAVKAQLRGPTGNLAEILDACANYAFENPTVLLAGTVQGMPIVVAHTNTYYGRTTFRFQTLYRPSASMSLQAGKGLVIPVEYRDDLLAGAAKLYAETVKARG